MNNKHKTITITPNHHQQHQNDDPETGSVSSTVSEKEELERYVIQTTELIAAITEKNIAIIKSLLENEKYQHLFYYTIDDLPAGKTTIVEDIKNSKKYDELRLLIKCGIDINEIVTEDDDTLIDIIKEEPSIIYEQDLIVQKPELISIFFPEITFDDSLTLEEKQEQLNMETERILNEVKQPQRKRRRRTESTEEEMQEREKNKIVIINFNWYIKTYLIKISPY